MPERNTWARISTCQGREGIFKAPTTGSCFWWIYGERAGNCALNHPWGRKIQNFVLFCFYHQSPMWATKISHKNTCLLKQRLELPSRSTTIYLHHPAGLEDCPGTSAEKQRDITAARSGDFCLWHGHNWDSEGDCLRIGVREQNPRFTLRHLSKWRVSCQTALPGDHSPHSS